MKLALVYDRINKLGGAERVLTTLHQLWPEAPIYTSIYDPKKASWAKDIQIVPSFLNSVPIVKSKHEWFANFMPYAFESFDLSSFDVVISITSAEAKGVITQPHQLHLCYLLTPTRYLWSHRLDYQGRGLKAYIREPFMDSLSAWDLVASSRPDKYIAISQVVADRCQHYYHRQPDKIIYPPVQTDLFKSHPSTCMSPGENYFLIVSRLVPYKRVELAIQACNQTGDRLIVVGTGSELSKLKSLAGESVTFTGQVTDSELACLYHHAKGLIFPQEEEFGITAIEAQAAGLPVVAYRSGSAPEIILPNQTGIFFDHQTMSDLEQALTTFKTHTWYDKTIKAHAAQFDQSVFMRQFKQFVEDSWQHHNQK